MIPLDVRIRTKSGYTLPLDAIVMDILDLLDGNGAIITDNELAVYELTCYLSFTLPTTTEEAV